MNLQVINMQRLTTIPREKPVYTLSKIKIMH